MAVAALKSIDLVGSVQRAEKPTMTWEGIIGKFNAVKDTESANELRNLQLKLEQFSVAANPQGLKTTPPDFEYYKKASPNPAPFVAFENEWKKIDWTKLPQMNILPKFTEAVQEAQQIIDTEGAKEMQEFDAEMAEMKKELIRVIEMRKQFLDPYFTVDKALEYFPGMREEIEKEMLDSAYPWETEQDVWELEKQEHAKHAHDKEHGHH